jgi:probable F420-dependent oxidoreductase
MTTDRTVQFAIAMPQIFRQPRIDLDGLRAFLTRAEALGYHSAWVQEQVLGAAASLEPVVALAYAAALTREIRLGVAVLLTPLRTPVQLAKSLATLDQLSAGRLIAGVGLGGRLNLYPAVGLTPERRVRRFVAGLELMKRLWTEDRVSVDGPFWTLDGAAIAPRPIQTPHPPLWFGAHHPDALRRAVALGDGFIGAGSSSTADFRSHVDHLRRGLDVAKRDPATFPIAKRVYLAVDPDKERAMARLREWFGWYYGNAGLADRVALAGGVEECAAGLREVRAAGAELILLNFVEDEAANAEMAARELAPRVAR